MELVLQDRPVTPAHGSGTAAVPEGGGGISGLGEKWGKLMQEAEARWVGPETLAQRLPAASAVLCPPVPSRRALPLAPGLPWQRHHHHPPVPGGTVPRRPAARGAGLVSRASPGSAGCRRRTAQPSPPPAMRGSVRSGSGMVPSGGRGLCSGTGSRHVSPLLPGPGVSWFCRCSGTRPGSSRARAGPWPPAAGVRLGLARSSVAACRSVAMPVPSLVGSVMAGQGGSCPAGTGSRWVTEPGRGCLILRPRVPTPHRDEGPGTVSLPSRCSRRCLGQSGGAGLTSPLARGVGTFGAGDGGTPELGIGHPAPVAGGQAASPSSTSVRRPLSPSPAHPSFPAQVRPPGADPAGGTGLPGGGGLLPGVARCHGAAAGPALARRRLRRPRAGRPPANPGQGSGGRRHPPRHGRHGEGWGTAGTGCHRSLSPRPSARRSAGGWESWTSPWRAGSGCWRW